MDAVGRGVAQSSTAYSSAAKGIAGRLVRVAQLARIGALAEAETDAVEGVRVLEHPEDAEGALGIRQAARLVRARRQLRRQRGGAAVRQGVPLDGEPHDGGVGGREASP